MCTSFSNLSILKYQNKVCVLYCRKPVSYHQNSFILGQPLKGKLYLMFVLGVCKCCGFIENDDGSIFKIALANAILWFSPPER